MTISVSLFNFTPPESMPWIKCIPPTEAEVLTGLIPKDNVWVVPDSDVDSKVENAGG